MGHGTERSILGDEVRNRKHRSPGGGGDVWSRKKKPDYSIKK